MSRQVTQKNHYSIIKEMNGVKFMRTNKRERAYPILLAYEKDHNMQFGVHIVLNGIFMEKRWA